MTKIVHLFRKFERLGGDFHPAVSFDVDQKVFVFEGSEQVSISDKGYNLSLLTILNEPQIWNRLKEIGAESVEKAIDSDSFFTMFASRSSVEYSDLLAEFIATIRSVSLAERMRKEINGWKFLKKGDAGRIINKLKRAV